MSKASDKAAPILAEWREAYEAANGKKPPMIVYQGGWVVVSMSSETMVHRRRVRLSVVPDWTQELRQRVLAREMRS